jgi:hypothetical protein
MDDLNVSISLWLPVGRANFYSSTANGWLLKPENATGMMPASSKMIDTAGYRPRLQVSVLRRVLEVLPVSFGYERTSICTFDDADDVKRPAAVTMTLRPKADLMRWEACPERTANLPLVEAGVPEVTFHVDEHGAYTFSAKARPDADVRCALLAHVREVFGGDYSLDRRSIHGAAGAVDNAGGRAVRSYQGLDAGSPAATEKPRGILTFFQLNTLVEGLFNESLSPAVFFEQNEDLDRFLADQPPGSLTLIREMREVVDLLKVDDLEAATPEALLAVMRRFLDVTGREVLQKLKWSVESVRRSLLDESVGMLHRQSKLIQLDLGALTKEWTPEMAVGASESQLRGYVMLAAAKLPLVTNVLEMAQLVKEHLSHVGEAARTHAVPAHGVPGSLMPGAATLTADGPATAPADGRRMARDVKRLEVDLKYWTALLTGLRNNVHGLEQAIEHAWRENLLYEQRAVRSEQEAMAEITRSRSGRPGGERGNLNAYNIVTLLFTVAAVLVAIREGNILDPASVSSDWRTWVRALSPIALVTIVFTLVVPLYNRFRRRSRDKKGYSETYPYEFTFRLEEAADPVKVYAHLAERKQRTIETPILKKKVTLTSLGGGRIERVSQHRALVKLHSTATIKVRKGQYARFEIVKEILAHRVSGKPNFVIIQCRMFGDSPEALKPNEVLDLISAILQDVGTRLTGSDEQGGDAEGIEVGDVLGLIAPLLSAATPADAVRAGGERTVNRIPTQRS